MRKTKNLYRRSICEANTREVQAEGAGPMESLVIVIIIIVIVVVVMGIQSRLVEDNILTGIWKGSPDFCASAGLGVFLLKIGKQESLINTTRLCYLLATNEEGIILNNPVNIDFGMSLTTDLSITKSKSYNIVIDWLGEESPGFFPSRQTLTFYPKYGKIVISNEDEVTAILYKDHDSEDVLRVLPSNISEETTSDEI